ncbi:unnamed protein product, partial [Acanthocheilonema viteae]
MNSFHPHLTIRNVKCQTPKLQGRDNGIVRDNQNSHCSIKYMREEGERLIPFGRWGPVRVGADPVTQIVMPPHTEPVTVAFCPNLDSCTCNDKPDGYYIDCKDIIDTSLSDIIQSLGRRQVQRLTITNASWPVLKELPSANIRSLQLISCGIKNIMDATFAKLADNLEHLTITENMLTNVTLLGYLPKLTSVNLNYNQLTDLPDNALKGAESLRHLRLEGNKICSLS